jgi:hypothetical protein
MSEILQQTTTLMEVNHWKYPISQSQLHLGHCMQEIEHAMIETWWPMPKYKDTQQFSGQARATREAQAIRRV